MSTSDAQEVERLIEEGLDLYGMGEVSRAFQIWRRALELDPENVVALDYMRTADRRKRPRPEKSTAEQRSDALLSEARSLLDAGQVESAYELLTTGADGALLAVEAMSDLTRTLLHRQDRARFPDLARVPALKAEPAALTRFNLSPDAGFLLSRMDGQTPLSDLISLSNMSAFETLRVVARMCEAGILELRG